MALTRSGRFVDNYTSKRQQYNWNPISGYKDRDVKSLEEAVESIVPFVDKVMQYAEEAKQKCRKNTKLTINESAAIYLYTMNTPFYETLNEALRGENPPALVPCTPIPEGKHVMISYDSNSQEIVSKIYHYLQLEHIPLWLNKQKETTNDLKKSLAEGVENAAVVCCFMTHDYEKSDFCQFELQYAQKRQKRIIPCMLTDVKTWNPSDWLESIIEDLVPVDFHNVSDPSIMEENVMELIYRIKYQHSTSQYIPSQVADKPSYLFELIKYEYKQNSRIERFMNPAKSFPIDQSYINLAIVETKDQQEKEKKLRDSQHNDAIIEAFENIHGTKTPIDVKDIFKTCKDKRRNVLVFGRAGIGKSTFCRYIAYQWATGIIWQKYELIALIPLRSLTADRYPILPAGANYSLIVILRKECFSFDQYLSEKDETQLQDQFHNSRILWLLDGYDEIVQNVPTYLKSLLNDQLLKTPHHIITSRPYMNTLSHSVQLEITGFTDDNISKYVKQFLDQVENEAQNLSGEDKKILSFLKRNPRIHGIAHIPINLELICSVWSNTHWPETEIETLTMTGLYDEITEWICRRYLMKQKGISTEKLKLTSKSDVYEDSDSGNSRVLFWPRNAISGTLIAGNNTAGSSNYALYNAYGISRDSSSDTLYVADFGNNRIMSYLSNATFGTVVAGGNGGGTNYTQLDGPISVYFDALSNSLLIVNYLANNIVRWTIGDSMWTLIAGSANSSAGTTSTLLYYPIGMTLDPMGNMYVADAGNHRIQFYPTNQSIASTIAGVTNSQGSNATHLYNPYGLALDSQLNLYVADTANNRIQKFVRY
ncbi:unnamed protein product [Adineta steineri]|uniref:TIR domain-containing protein n=1 Tax=Adineta steineri TaxID=433720 RepID=A0A813RKB2_9BILA|nr:unnamed protein product [Adineta steineri]